MSTQIATSNAVIIRKIYEAFMQGDIPYILDQVDDDCQWNGIGAPLIDHAGRYVGKGTSLFFSKLKAEFEFPTFEVEDIYEVTETDVIAKGYFVARSCKTGKNAQTPYLMLFRLKNGKVVYFQNYYDSVQLALSLQA